MVYEELLKSHLMYHLAGYEKENLHEFVNRLMDAHEMDRLNVESAYENVKEELLGGVAGS